MKTGDMVVATRKTIRVGQRDNRYFGILVKNEGGIRFIECGGPKVGQFGCDFWDVEVVSSCENR
jgi:hypothetical protein